MGTSIITHTETDPNGNALNYVANFRLTTAAGQESGFRLSNGTGISSIYTTTSNGSGAISVALENNANITPGGSFYVAELLLPSTAGGTQEAAIISSSSASPQTLYAALLSAIPSYVPPTTVPPTVLTGNNTFTGINQFNGNVLFKNGRPWADVMAWGAVGDAITDDAAAIQAAINAIAALGGGVVYFPPAPNGYRIQSTVSVTTNGITLQGASRATARIFVATNSDGILVQDCNDPIIKDLLVETAGPAGTYAPNSLIHLLSTQGNNINRGKIENVRVIGRSKNAQVGVWLEFSGTNSGGNYDCIFDLVDVTDCVIGWRIECSAVAVFTQRNVQHHWLGGVCDSCTTGFYVRNCGLFNLYGLDNAGHTTGWDLSGAQNITWFGAYSAGHATEWAIGAAGVASGQTSRLLWIGGAIADQNTFILGTGVYQAGDETGQRILKGAIGRLGRNTGGVAGGGKLVAVGASQGANLFSATGTSTSAAAVLLATFVPDSGAVGISTSAAAAYAVSYDVVGQSATKGNAGGGSVSQAFQAINAGPIAVTAIGTTCFASVPSVPAGWDITLTNSSTRFYLSVHGGAGEIVTWNAIGRISESIST